MTEQWLVVATKPRQEARAEENLQRQGYSPYLPRMTVKKRRRQRWENLVEPTFPGYLFLLVDPQAQSLAPVRSTLGVRHLVRFGDEPATVPDGIIQFLQGRDPALHPVAEQGESPFSPGAPVDILDGPFKGLTAVFDMPKSQDRALLLVTLLGRCNRIEIDINHIQPQ